jgi:hypothetical protein
MEPTDAQFRSALAELVVRTGRSRRALSSAMGRDQGYVAALLDPSRPSRARPTPADLLRLSDASGIPFVELLEALWGIPRARLADEVRALGLCGTDERRQANLSPRERAEVDDFIGFLASRHGRA